MLYRCDLFLSLKVKTVFEMMYGISCVCVTMLWRLHDTSFVLSSLFVYMCNLPAEHEDVMANLVK